MNSDNNSGKTVQKRPFVRFLIMCIIVTAFIVLSLFSVSRYIKSQIAPVCVLTVQGLEADTPARAQAICRADNTRFSGYSEEYEGCEWVWCGDDKLYLVLPDRIDVEDPDSAFPAVTFKDADRVERNGYIIDPTVASNVLGRIRIDTSTGYTFDSVSMSIRAALRNGSVAYENAAYLWIDGTDEVLAVKNDCFTVIEYSTVSFVNDGGETVICYLLDTNID